jgi:hypothetical protein
VERPQPGGAGCGYTSSFEAIVSRTSMRRLMLRNIDNQGAAANQSRTDRCQSGSDRGTSHKLIDHTHFLHLTLARCMRSFAALRMTRVYY